MKDEQVKQSGMVMNNELEIRDGVCEHDVECVVLCDAVLWFPFFSSQKTIEKE